jgi:hypothetical protein
MANERHVTRIVGRTQNHSDTDLCAESPINDLIGNSFFCLFWRNFPNSELFSYLNFPFGDDIIIIHMKFCIGFF